MSRKKIKTRSKSKIKPRKNKKVKHRRKSTKTSSSELKFRISPKIMKSIGAVVFYVSALLIFISFVSTEGQLLHSIHRIIISLIGWGIVFIPILFIFAGSMLIKPSWKISKPSLLFGGIVLFISSVCITKAGSLGMEFWASISILISGLGAFLVFLSGIIIGLMVIFEWSLIDMLSFVSNIFKKLLFKKVDKKELEMDNLFDKKLSRPTLEDRIDWDKRLKKDKVKRPQDKVNSNNSILDIKNKKTNIVDERSVPESAMNVEGAEKNWRFPPIALLSEIDDGDADRGDIKNNAQIVEDTLQSFGVDAKVVDYNPGPTVTQYAIKLATGTKLTKVTSLTNDLALALAARTGQIRIEAPIPGRSLVGIELPNISPSMVSLRSLLASPAMAKSKDPLLVALGQDISGNVVAVDLAKMPHVLIAGSTGSGKSVCINSLLMSILFRTSPNEVKLILVDPKRVELSVYNNIPHLLTPVIVDPEQVVSALKWVVVEMENRYKLFAEAGIRDITSYNKMAGFQAMPYILIVIDELADIMLFAPSEVEESITRIAQKARAAGIHMVLATQRPSVDVITGLIKANVPSRISFNVSSMMDSRVILDSPGAEKLLGKGDMLYIPPDQAKPKRVQGAFVSDEDIKKVTSFVKENATTVQYTEEVVSKYKGKSIKGGKIQSGDDVDVLFDKAVKIVVNQGKASASFLQRRLSIGYNRAARIIDQLHDSGVVSAAQGSKPRDVLIKSAEEFLATRES